MTTPIPESRGIRKSVQKKGRLGLKGDMRVKIERRCNSTYIPISSFTMHSVAGDTIRVILCFSVPVSLDISPDARRMVGYLCKILTIVYAAPVSAKSSVCISFVFLSHRKITYA